MPTTQTYFNRFNEKIRISYEEDTKLRDKRDLLLDNIRHCIKYFANHNNITIPHFDTFNQGSYDLRTGIKPLYSEDHDIDVGIVFQIKRNEADPQKLVNLVFQALQSPNRTVEKKRPCLRVQYHKNDEKTYHVDIAIYCVEQGLWNSENYFLARSPKTGSKDIKLWEQAAPFRLKEIFREKYQKNEELEQFRRIIRYLKRWKDISFSATGNNRPTGIGLTACVYNWTTYQQINLDTGKSEDYDLGGLIQVVDKIIGSFNSWTNRLVVNLPVVPNNDLFEKMTDSQMQNFKNKLLNLQNSLKQASQAKYINEFCNPLRNVFGEDFPNEL